MSGGGIGTTQCYLETTLNIGLFQRDQLVYYYCDFAGTITDEIHENEIGMDMDWYEELVLLIVAVAICTATHVLHCVCCFLLPRCFVCALQHLHP